MTAANRHGKSSDAWLAETVTARILAEKSDEAARARRRAGLGPFLEEREAEDGACTDAGDLRKPCAVPGFKALVTGG